MALKKNEKLEKTSIDLDKKETTNTIPMNQKEKNDKKSTLKKIDNKTSDFTKVLVAKSKGLQRKEGEATIIYDEILLNELKQIIAKYTEHPEILDEINVKYSGNQEKLGEIDAKMESNFIERLNIDSVDFVEIIVDTEEKFGIKIEDEEVKKIVNFDEMYLLIQSKIANKNVTTKISTAKKSPKTKKNATVVAVKTETVSIKSQKISKSEKKSPKVAKTTISINASPKKKVK
ncbi:acyl carrier protein [Rhizosphaericola mali]|nr:acyl carrier protein [Rhizosphaericola mali]